LVVYEINKHVLPTAPSPTTTHFIFCMIKMSFVNLSTEDAIEKSSIELAKIISTLHNLPEKEKVPVEIINSLVPPDDVESFLKLELSVQLATLREIIEDLKNRIARAGEAARKSEILSPEPKIKTQKSIKPGNWGIIEGAPKELVEAIQFLEEANGKDAYSSEAIALGKLSRKEYLALPKNFVIPEIPPDQIGSADVYQKFKIQDLIQIYALNKAIAPANVNAPLFALARMEAVKLGWLKKGDQKEVQYLDPLIDAEAIFAADIRANRDNIEEMRGIAFLTPFYAEWVFRTTGHHYITADSATYVSKYEAIARASLGKPASAIFPGEVAYHTLFHWISPGRAYQALTELETSERIPEAIKIRMKAAPAGTALITTTAAVFQSMKTAAFYPEFVTLSRGEVEEIIAFSEVIKADPTKWHKTSTAYGRSPISELRKAELEDNRRKAANWAPITQAYINALMKHAPLGRAKTLDKHSVANPLLKEKAQKFFRTMAKADIAHFADLFGS